MGFGMTPVSIPGISIRPPSRAPGEKPKTTPSKRKPRPILKRKPVKRPTKTKLR
jgi:hypothetical protein